MPSETQLVLDDVHVTYNHAIQALSGVSLEVRTGEMVALLGANGAGKSTTLKAVSNLLPAERGQVTRGRIRYLDSDVVSATSADLVRKGLAQVLEGRHCFRSLTVEENLVTGALGRQARDREIQSDLAWIYEIFPRLLEKRRVLAGLTSGGEQQMTAIGRALMSRPRLLVLDEPSMGLAPRIVQEIFKTLKRLNAELGLSILVAEQNSAIALRFADRASVLENGRTALEGNAKDLSKDHRIKALYLGAARQFEAVI
jgi:branched-chain amino acid transport system ATP-binding protein